MLRNHRLLSCAAAVSLALTGIGTAAPVSAATAAPAAKGAMLARAHSAVLIDADSGEILYDDQPVALRHPASITKIMTLYMTFEAIEAGKLSLKDKVVMSARGAAQQPSKLGLKVGESLTVDEAIRAVAVKSANDVATALAETVAGSESRFASRMTARAKSLGMDDTVYVNASGLPDARQVSTALDIAVLSMAIVRDFPAYYAYFSEPSFTFRGQVMTNHNNLMRKMPDMDGLKTGFIRASGFNLAASAKQKDRRLIAVVLGAPSAAARDREVQSLLTRGFELAVMRGRGGEADLVGIKGAGEERAYVVRRRLDTAAAKPLTPVNRPIAVATR